MDRWYQVGCSHKAPDAEWVLFGPGGPAADRQSQGIDRSAESRCRNGGYPRLADGAVEGGLEKSWKSLKIFLTTEGAVHCKQTPTISHKGCICFATKATAEVEVSSADSRLGVGVLQVIVVCPQSPRRGPLRLAFYADGY